MHEVSLVRSIFHTLEEEFGPDALDRLQRIELRIGLLANVEPVLLQNAFKAWTQAEDRFTAVELAIEMVPIEVECPACGRRSTVENYRFECSHCHRPTNQIVHGTELLIHRVHFAERQPDGEMKAN
ncbi:MAG: hydrogenase maturation nickel metallochaperone HypA [Bacteroidetes bacterium]|nr:MAG: hydrogenase maturation nickel metallochaperone HypA [Bacteroidota bacterium]